MSNDKKPVVASPGALAQIVRTLRLVWRLLNDPRISLFPKLIPLAAVLYVLSPIDLLPDLVLGFGQLDDVGISMLGIALFIEMCPRAIVDEHRAALAAEMGTPRKEEEVIDGSYRVVDDDGTPPAR
jgi:uncharacterized membrane protein YkvA (DUF1232 family)